MQKRYPSLLYSRYPLILKTLQLVYRIFATRQNEEKRGMRPSRTAHWWTRWTRCSLANLYQALGRWWAFSVDVQAKEPGETQHYATLRHISSACIPVQVYISLFIFLNIVTLRHISSACIFKKNREILQAQCNSWKHCALRPESWKLPWARNILVDQKKYNENTLFLASNRLFMSCSTFPRIQLLKTLPCTYPMVLL